MKILITPTSMKEDSMHPALTQLKEFADELVFNPFGRSLTKEELIPLLKECDGYLAGLDEISKEVIMECKKLKVISRYGAGYDKVDLQEASRLGIIVTNTPGANAESVGELAFGMALALARQLVMLDKKTKDNQWVRTTGVELYGKKMGIVGLGAIGKVVARCSAGFGMQIMAYDPYINEAYCREAGILNSDLETLLCEADVISLHLPLKEETRHVINEETIGKMKKGVLLINASRGGLIDEAAVEAALLDGRIGGLGVDAFEQEPPIDSPLLRLDNCIATPHTGAHTKEAADHMTQMAVENLMLVLSGKESDYIVNKKMLSESF